MGNKYVPRNETGTGMQNQYDGGGCPCRQKNGFMKR